MSEWVKYDDKRFEQGLETLGRGLTSALLDGARYGAELARREVLSRTILVRRVNIQDQDEGPPWKATNPVSLRGDNKAGYTLILRSHWTGARSAPIRSAYERHGLVERLRRPGLWISRRGSKRSSSRGYTTRDGLTFINFSADVRLYAWAQQPERGYQLRRHAVYLSSVDARRYLVADPSLRRVRPQLLSHITQEVRKI